MGVGSAACRGHRQGGARGPVWFAPLLTGNAEGGGASDCGALRVKTSGQNPLHAARVVTVS